MSRYILSLVLVASLLQGGSAIGSSIAALLNFRCTYSDTFLKNPLKIYDEIIAPNMVSFYYYSKTKEPFSIRRSTNGTYFTEDFDLRKTTRVIIHGYWNSHNSRINKSLRKIYLTYYDVNLIIVNYSRISRDSCYKIARNRIGILSRRIAEFLDDILGFDEWQWRNLILVGHSLGAHTAGVVGRSVLKGKIGAIYALDPAGPGFKEETENRLRKDDADYVECLHTNGKTFGLMNPLCTVDLYPNFGWVQPGCNYITKDLCSHSRAWQFFAESLLNEFEANQCDSIQQINDKSPCNGTAIIMGGDDFTAKKNVSGIFYLETNDKPPFSKIIF